MKKQLKSVFQEERRPCFIYHYKCRPLVNECTNTMNQKRNRKSYHFLWPLSAYVTFEENLKMHTLYWAQHTWLVCHCIFVTLFGQWQLKPPWQVPGEPQCEPPSPCILPGQGDPISHQPRKWGANFHLPLAPGAFCTGICCLYTKYGRELQPTDKITC